MVDKRITESKRAKKELREREAQYQSIFESTSDAVLIFRFDGTIVDANPAAQRLYGYSYDELIGLSGKDIVHPNYYHLFKDYVRQVKTSGRFSAQSVDLRKDGSSIDVEVHGASFSYKGKPHLLAVVRDITERVLARQMLEQRVAERTRELQTLLDVAAAASSSLELDEMLSATLDRLVTLVGVSRAGVILLDSKLGELEPRMIRPEHPVAPEDLAEMCQVCGEVIASGEPLYVPVDAALRHSEPGALLPLRARGQAVGVLVIIGPKGGTFSESQLALFGSIADQLGVAVENARLYARVERAAIATERARLARELHDSVTQSLYSMTLFAEAARRLIVSEDYESVEEYLSQLCETSQQALKEMRLLVYELRPSALEEAGLVGMLRQRLDTVEKRAGIEVQLLIEGQPDLPKEIEEGLYRIAQEALNNSLKHAAASAVTVRIQIEGELLTMEIADNGRGFDLDAATDTGGIGLSTMHERAEKLDGDLRIASTPGKGTKVQVRVKVR